MKVSFKRNFLGIVLPQTVLAATAIIDCVINGPSLWLLAALVMSIWVFALGEGVFLHRYFSHRAFDCDARIAKFFGTLGCVAGFGGPITYKAHHVGLHHAHADTERDPHSPRTRGIWHSAIAWHWRTHDLPMVVSREWLRDPYWTWIQEKSVSVYVITAGIAAIIDWRIAVYCWGLAPFWGHVAVAWANVMGHGWLGTRRYDTADCSRNQWWASWLFWQGSAALQNNHHRWPARYHDSERWWEFDIARWFVPLINRRPRQ